MINIQSAANPRATASCGILLDVTIEGIQGVKQFHAISTDVEEHGRELYQRAMDGEFGPVAPYVEPAKTKNQLIKEIRVQKASTRDGGMEVNGILFDTDANARLAYNELALRFLANPAYTVENWKASEGVWVTMNYTLYSAIVVKGEELLSNLFTWQKEQEELINSGV